MEDKENWKRNAGLLSVSEGDQADHQTSDFSLCRPPGRRACRSHRLATQWPGASSPTMFPALPFQNLTTTNRAIPRPPGRRESRSRSLAIATTERMEAEKEAEASSSPMFPALPVQRLAANYFGDQPITSTDLSSEEPRLLPLMEAVFSKGEINTIARPPVAAPAHGLLNCDPETSAGDSESSSNQQMGIQCKSTDNEDLPKLKKKVAKGQSKKITPKPSPASMTFLDLTFPGGSPMSGPLCGRAIKMDRRTDEEEKRRENAVPIAGKTYAPPTKSNQRQVRMAEPLFTANKRENMPPLAVIALSFNGNQQRGAKIVEKADKERNDDGEKKPHPPGGFPKRASVRSMKKLRPPLQAQCSQSSGHLPEAKILPLLRQPCPPAECHAEKQASCRQTRPKSGAHSPSIKRVDNSVLSFPENTPQDIASINTDYRATNTFAVVPPIPATVPTPPANPRTQKHVTEKSGLAFLKAVAEEEKERHEKQKYEPLCFPVSGITNVFVCLPVPWCQPGAMGGDDGCRSLPKPRLPMESTVLLSRRAAVQNGKRCPFCMTAPMPPLTELTKPSGKNVPHSRAEADRRWAAQRGRRRRLGKYRPEAEMNGLRGFPLHLCEGPLPPLRLSVSPGLCPVLEVEEDEEMVQYWNDQTTIIPLVKYKRGVCTVRYPREFPFIPKCRAVRIRAHRIVLTGPEWYCTF